MTITEATTLAFLLGLQTGIIIAFSVILLGYIIGRKL